MWILYVLSIILILLFCYFVSPKFKGKYGEYLVKKKLKKIEKNNYYIINNLIISNKDKTNITQIDHVFISKKGIFSIETKNYSGNIYGDDYNNTWTQTLNYGKIKNKFYSPVKQNQLHCNQLSTLLKNKYIINNIVIFIKGNIENNKSLHTFSFKKFEKYYDTLTNILNDKEVDNINKIINDNINIITKKEHMNYLKNKNSITDKVCPKCKSKLLLKKGKYGPFYGCSNYPECDYTESIKDK